MTAPIYFFNVGLAAEKAAAITLSIWCLVMRLRGKTIAAGIPNISTTPAAPGSANAMLSRAMNIRIQHPSSLRDLHRFTAQWQPNRRDCRQMNDVVSNFDRVRRIHNFLPSLSVLL
jgi:hypothetical protein